MSGFDQETNPKRVELLLMLMSLDHTLLILRQGDYGDIGLTFKLSQIPNPKTLNQRYRTLH